MFSHQLFRRQSNENLELEARFQGLELIQSDSQLGRLGLRSIASLLNSMVAWIIRFREIAPGLMFLLIGASMVLVSLKFPPSGDGVPGPAFFPMLVGSLLGLLGLIEALRRFRETAEPADQEKWGRGTGLVLLVGALSATFILLWDQVHFLLRTPVFLLFLYRLFKLSWLHSLLLAILISAALFGLFQGLFQIRL